MFHRSRERRWMLLSGFGRLGRARWAPLPATPPSHCSSALASFGFGTRWAHHSWRLHLRTEVPGSVREFTAGLCVSRIGTPSLNWQPIISRALAQILKALISFYRASCCCCLWLCLQGYFERILHGCAILVCESLTCEVYCRWRAVGDCYVFTTATAVLFIMLQIRPDILRPDTLGSESVVT